MASGLEESGVASYEQFVSPKRKRMLSPNNVVKSSKDHGATLIPKHRQIVLDEEDVEFGSESPSTNFFLRQPADRKLNFNGLKKGNIFGEDGNEHESEFDADVDADDSRNRRFATTNESFNKMEINKGFRRSRAFAETKSVRVDEGMKDVDIEVDAGVESDYSGVAGRMSSLSVGKRGSSFGLPKAKRGSPGSSPASQNSSVNSSLLMSPAQEFPGHLLMADFHNTDSGGGAAIRTRNRRTKTSSLISSAILNSGHEASPAGVPSRNTSLASAGSSANNTHIAPFKQRNGTWTNQSHTTEAMHNCSSDASYHSHGSHGQQDNSDSFQLHLSNGTSLEYSGHMDSSGEKPSLCSAAGAGDDVDHRKHQQHRHSDGGCEGGSDVHLDEWDDMLAKRPAHNLPPRTPAVPKHAAATPAHVNSPGSPSGAGRRGLFPGLDEEEKESHHHQQLLQQQSGRSPQHSTRSASKRAAQEVTGDGNQRCQQQGPQHGSSASPLQQTPSRPSRRPPTGQKQQPSGSQPMSQPLSQQSPEASMGDLGSPVSEVGSPAVLLYEEDEDGPMDGFDDADSPSPSGAVLGRRGGRGLWVGGGMHNCSLLGDSPASASPSGDNAEEEEDEDDPELARLAFPSAHSAIVDRKYPHRGAAGGQSPGTLHTSALKNKLFDDAGQTEADHQYHLFDQRFIGVTPTAGVDLDIHGRAMSPLYCESKRQEQQGGHQDVSEDLSDRSGDIEGDHEGDTVLDSSADTTAMSTSGASSDILHMSKSSGSNSNSRNTSSSCIDMHSDGGGNNNSFGNSSHGARSLGSLGTLPLPDQSAFDGSGQADLSRSSSYANSSQGHIDAAHFGSPSSARKKRPAHAAHLHFPQSPPSYGSTPCSPAGALYAKSSCPPTPLYGEQWDALGNVGSPSHSKHQRHGNSGSMSRAATDSSAATLVKNTPSPVKVIGAVGIAVPNSGASTASCASKGSSSSHDSDILSHNWHNNQFDVSGSESPAIFSSLTNSNGAHTLVRQSSLLDTKMLLTQSEEDQDARRTITYLQDFEEIGMLGSGTFADVYKVRQLWGNQQQQNVFYAVKKSKRQFRNKKERERLMAEVRAMKLLGLHNNANACAYVVPFIRAWQEDSFFYVQMGFAERGTLRGLLHHLAEPAHSQSRRRGLSSSAISAVAGAASAAGAGGGAGGTLVPDNTIWHVVHDVCSGLSHIHRCGMVHLDIKPANLLITEQGTIQIGDFGMAAQIGSNDDVQEGDARYMAEELLNDRRVPSADMFSLGLTLYEIACFYADDGGSHTDSERELRITVRLGLPQNGPLWHTLREDRAPPLPSHRCPALQNLVTACMRRMPEARPSAAQVLFLEQVEEVEDDVDPVLLCAPKYVDPPRGTQMRPQFGRSSSVNEAGAAWGAAPEGGHFGLQGAGTGQQGQGQGGGGGLSLGISVSVNNEIDYAALGDGAFTPNFNHHSYSPH